MIYVTIPNRYEAERRQVRLKINSHLKTSAKVTENKTELFNLMEENNFREDPAAQCTLGLISTLQSHQITLFIFLANIPSRIYQFQEITSRSSVHYPTHKIVCKRLITFRSSSHYLHRTKYTSVKSKLLTLALNRHDATRSRKPRFLKYPRTKR